MKKKLNKKGFSMIAESDKLMFWFILLGVIILCMIFIIAWTTALKKMYLNDALQTTAYESRLVYSDKCFAYKDADTGRIYTGTIDITKFTDETLFNCLPLEGSAQHAISAKLETSDGNTFFVESYNWEKEIEQVVMRTYVVEVYNQGPALLTFYHRIGN